MTLPKKLKKKVKELLTKIPDLTATKEYFAEGLIRIYHMESHMIVSLGEFYQQFALWGGPDKIACEIVGPINLENIQYSDWQVNKFQELGYVLDEMFGNYQKVIKITKDDDLLAIVKLFTKVAYEIMDFPKSTKFDFEFGQ
jgi:hypothetical protein